MKIYRIKNYELGDRWLQKQLASVSNKNFSYYLLLALNHQFKLDWVLANGN